MSSDLPPFPGRSRSTYSVAPKRPRRSWRRHGEDSIHDHHGPSRKTYKAHGHPGDRRWPRRALITLAVLIPLVIVAGAGGYIYTYFRLEGIPRISVPALTPQKSGQPIDILLIGSDSRADVNSCAGAKSYGSSATVSGQRSDTIIVMRLAGSEVEMLSIPRDSFVPIAGTGGQDNKINAAFNNGPNQLVATIQDDFGIPINHVMIAQFCGFVGMVNALGGISLNFPDPVEDSVAGLYVQKTGCQTLDGKQALALVRSRDLWYYADHAWNYDGNGDFSRIRRQQAFFHALLDRVHSVIPNLFKLNAFLGATVSDLTVDSGFGSGQMISLGLDYHSLGESNLKTEVLPMHEAVFDGSDILLPARPLDNRMIRSFLALGTTPSAGAPTTSTRSGASTTTTTVPVTGTTSIAVVDNATNYPEPWNPTPC